MFVQVSKRKHCCVVRLKKKQPHTRRNQLQDLGKPQGLEEQRATRTNVRPGEAVGGFHTGLSSLTIIPAKQFAVMLKLVWLAVNVGHGIRLETMDC